MKKTALVVNPADNVATALTDIPAGTRVQVATGRGNREVTLLEAVPFGYKFAVVPVSAGEDVVKYGENIGRATCDIGAGQVVHVHNLESRRGRGDRAGEVQQR